MILKILTITVLAILIYTAYLQGYNDAPYKLINQTITKYVVNGTTCDNITEKTVYITERKTHVEINYETLDLTEKQLNDIKNIKPEKCHTPACSEGFFQAKYQIFDILKINRPKFNERMSSGAYENVDDTEYIPVKTDGFGKYIELGKEWIISKNIYDIKNMSYLKNYTITNTTTYQNNTIWMRYNGTGVYIRRV